MDLDIDRDTARLKERWDAREERSFAILDRIERELGRIDPDVAERALDEAGILAEERGDAQEAAVIEVARRLQQRRN